MLYSTELPSHECCISAAKLRNFIDIFDFVADFCLNFGFLWYFCKKNTKNDEEMKLTKAWIKTIWTMCLLTCALTASAQLYNAPKHKHGDWYMGIGGGFSQSMAENADATDFIFHQMPT